MEAARGCPLRSNRHQSRKRTAALVAPELFRWWEFNGTSISGTNLAEFQTTNSPRVCGGYDRVASRRPQPQMVPCMRPATITWMTADGPRRDIDIFTDRLVTADVL